MNDDVKALRRRLINGEAPIDEVLAHLDAEPARLAAAREEQREACAVRGCAAMLASAPEVRCVGAEIRATPLTATPLADELERSWSEKAALADERDALRAAVATADEAVRYWTEQAQAGANEAAALRAQVEAARAVAQQGVGDHYMDDIATSVLRALGGAKP